MNYLLLMRVSASAKTEVKIVVGTVAVILLLPIFAVFTILHSGLSIFASGTVSADSGYLYQGELNKDDLYEWGNCTYWASLKRREAHKPIPNTWGNANTWATRADADGYLVDHTPTETAVMQTDRGLLGHVAYVTGVNPVDGSWTITEMNVKGLDIVDTATYPASAAANYYFIHGKVLSI